MVCGNCGRKIKDPISLERGYGPSCWKKINPGARAADQKIKRKMDLPGEDDQLPGQISIEEYLSSLQKQQGDYQ